MEYEAEPKFFLFFLLEAVEQLKTYKISAAEVSFFKTFREPVQKYKLFITEEVFQNFEEPRVKIIKFSI